MRAHVASPCERHATNVTDVFFNLRMCFHVGHQLGATKKSFAAHLANMILLP
jgi:hypothetical protein